MINFEYAKNVGCADLDGQRIDNCWSNPAMKPIVASLVAQLRNHIAPLVAYNCAQGLKAQIAAAKSSRKLDEVEEFHFGKIITEGSFPRRKAAYRRAFK